MIKNGPDHKIRLHIYCGSVLPFVQSGIFFCFMLIIRIYYHTPEQRKIPKCTKGKISPQHIYNLFMASNKKKLKKIKNTSID